MDQNKESEVMLEIVYQALENKKAEDIKILDIRHLTVIADYFIIAHGNNKNHVQSLIDETEKKLAENDYTPKQVEGYSTAKWILLDYNHIIIHIFDKEDRLFYDLERIWSDGKPIDLKIKEHSQ